MKGIYQIVNIVSKASLAKEIDLLAFSRAFTKEVNFGGEYYGGRFAHFKSREMQGRVAVWKSGKMMGLGTKTPEQAFSELKLVAEKLESDFSVLPSISNIVAVADLGFPIDFERVLLKASIEGLKVIYEPEQFPGAIIRFGDPFKTSILLFASGKTVIPGLKDEAQIEFAIERLKLLLSAE